MSVKHRLFAGQRLRELRKSVGLGQAAMAGRLGLSTSYLSQLENDDRPLTTAVLASIGRQFPLDLEHFQAGDPARRFTAIQDALDDPIFGGAIAPPEFVQRLVEQQPNFADNFATLHAAYRGAEERLLMLEDSISTGIAGSVRSPWEDVRDWFHQAGNYVDLLDRKAEELAQTIGFADSGFLSETALVGHLAIHHRVTVEIAAYMVAAPLFELDRDNHVLRISGGQPAASRRFLLAHQLAALEMATEIQSITENAELGTPEARKLLGVGLANYAAGALLMPYGAFRTAARSLRHDIDQLRQRFAVSFEQACHRLSTLQRPGARGIPFFFCRIDMAGNITKRHSATRLQFARFGGGCPLWNVHEAVAIPDRILVQLAETPDGVRYVQMAKGLVKPSGSYARAPRRYAVALGCEVEHANDFIYADAIDTRPAASATPIGITCRLCPRTDCDQRAFPPADRAIRIDPDRRDIVPYRVS